MDAAAVLEQYVSDISNLPGEIAHVLEEIRDKDLKFYETRKRITQRDNNQLQKFVRTHGSLAENPKELAAYPKIRADFEKAKALQVEKNDLAITGLYLVAKHLKKLNDKIDALEKEGLIAPELTGGYEDDLDAETLSKVMNLASDDIDTKNNSSRKSKSELMLPSSEMNPLLHSMIEAASYSSGGSGNYLASALAASEGLSGFGIAGFDGQVSGSSRSGSPSINLNLRDNKGNNLGHGSNTSQGYHHRSASGRQSRTAAAALAGAVGAGHRKHTHSNSRSSTPSSSSNYISGATGGYSDALNLANSTQSSTSSSSMSAVASSLGYGLGNNPNLKSIPASGKNTAAVAGISNSSSSLGAAAGLGSNSPHGPGHHGSSGRPTKRQKMLNATLSGMNANVSSGISGNTTGTGASSRSQRNLNRVGASSSASSRHATPNDEYSANLLSEGAGSAMSGSLAQSGNSFSNNGNGSAGGSINLNNSANNTNGNPLTKTSSRRATGLRFASANANNGTKDNENDSDSEEMVLPTKGSRRSDRTSHKHSNLSDSGSNPANSNTNIHSGHQRLGPNKNGGNLNSPSNPGHGGHGTTTLTITDNNNNTSIISQEAEDEVYCSCRQVSFGNMIACDNDNCPYEWFHWDCVGLVEPPQGKWYCPTCIQSMAKETTRKRSRN